MTKLVKFRISTVIGSFDRLGVVVDEKFLDLNLAYAAYLVNVAKEDVPYKIASARVPTDLLGFIEGGQKSIDAVREIIEYVKGDLQIGFSGPKGEKIIYDPQEVMLLPPLPSLKSRMFAMGRNFAAHLREPGRPPVRPLTQLPQCPAGFLKNPYSAIAHGDPIIYPKLITKNLDYEVELIAYIGKKGKNIKKDRSMDYIMGYTVGNDVSARDQQRLDIEDRRHIYVGKNADTFAPMGPYLVLKDEIPDPYVLRMELRVNGEVGQRGIVGEMVYKFEDILAYFSRDYTIYPGDVIWSGTPAAIKARIPLEPGDIVEAEVQNVGILRNKIIEE